MDKELLKEKLNELIDKEEEVCEEREKIQGQIGKICHELLIGKCFKYGKYKNEFCEEYSHYSCVTRFSRTMSSSCLTYIMIDFSDLNIDAIGSMTFGYGIKKVEDYTCQLVDELENAIEISFDEFKDAKNRMLQYLEKEMDRASKRK